VGGTIMADRIVTALYTEVFANSIPVLRIMLWALPGLFLGELLPRVALTLHLERQSARIDLGSAAVIVLLNLALVPTLGVIGGALALVVGRTVRLALFQSLIGRGRLAGPRRGRLLRVSLSAAVMGMIVLGLRWVTVLDAVDPRLGLLLVIGVGGIVYVLALLASGGVERRELSFLHDVTLARLARKRTG
jgi:O-antigen/teichoic acid export membrane protein